MAFSRIIENANKAKNFNESVFFFIVRYPAKILFFVPASFTSRPT